MQECNLRQDIKPIAYHTIPDTALTSQLLSLIKLEKLDQNLSSYGLKYGPYLLS